jgi:ABC-type phosphate transport system permease subunit
MATFLVETAHAAGVDMTAFGKLVDPIISNIVYPAVAFIFGLAVVIFTWGILQFVIHGNEPDARKKGVSTMIYGTIGMAIMVSAWGIIYLISNTVKGL